MIEATTPTAVSATFDAWAICSIVQSGDGLAPFGASAAGVVSMTVKLVKYRVRPDGVAERSPLPGDIATVTIPDLYVKAASDQTVATGLSAFTAAVVEVGKAQGVL